MLTVYVAMAVAAIPVLNLTTILATSAHTLEICTCAALCCCCKCVHVQLVVVIVEVVRVFPSRAKPAGHAQD